MAALRRGGGGRRLAGPGARPGPRQRHRPGGRARGGPRDRRAPVRLPHRQGQGRRARPDPRRRRGPGRGGARRARSRRPDPGRRQRRLGRRRRRSRRSGGSTARPAGWSTSSSRAPTVEDLAAVRRARRRADRGRRVDPAGRRPLPGARPRGRRHRGAQGAAARRGAGLPADRRGHRAAGRGVVGARDLGRASPPGVALAAALPELPLRLRARDRASCSPTTSSPTRSLPVDGALPVRRRRSRREHLDRLAAAPEREQHWRARLAEVRAVGRIGARDQPVDRSWPAPSSRALVEAGVTEVVLAPGSRNAPLAFAAYDAAAAGLLRLHTRIDERTAGFLALGLTKVGAPGGGGLHLRHRGRQPAPGDARGRARRRPAGRGHRRPAGPAARHRRQPDHRPGRDLRPAGAATSTSAPTTPRWPGPHCGLGDGPLHLNVQLDDPLVPDDRWDPAGSDGASAPPQPADRGRGGRAAPSETRSRDGLDPAPARAPSSSPATTPARRPGCSRSRRGWPLLAEPTSGSRTGANALRCYRLLLDGDARPPRSSGSWSSATRRCRRPVSRLLAATTSRCSSVPAAGRVAERPFAVDRAPRRAADGRRRRRPGWLERVARGRRRGRPRASTRCWPPRPSSRRTRSPARSAAPLPPGGLLVVGASSPIRDLDLMVAPYAVGDRRKVIANRGLSGIDGTVSHRDRRGPRPPARRRSLALMGDVTFLHDANGLVLGPDEPEPDLTIVVVNDDGGSIFAMLEQGAPEYADRYDRLFGTPARRRPRQPLRRHPHAALAGRVAPRARAGAGLAQRRDRGRRGAGPPRQPPRARRADPARLAQR